MKLVWFLAIALLVAGPLLRASDAIPAPTTGVSNTVKQPHVTAQLISEAPALSNKPFLVALHLHMDNDWHTYWINPGDAGLATSIKWTLPPGFTAGPIQWPTPEIHKMGPLTTYGYAGDTYLLTTITPPDKIGAKMPVDLKAHADWLVCQEECIPGKGDFTFQLDGPEPLAADEARQKFFAEAKARLPVLNPDWNVEASYTPRGGLAQPGQEVLWMVFRAKPGISSTLPEHAYFFPEQTNVTDPKEDDNRPPYWTGNSKSEFGWAVTLQQNGDKPAQVSGVIVSDRPWMGSATGIYVLAFRTDAKIAPAWASLSAPRAGARVVTEQPPAATQGAITAEAASRSSQALLLPVLGAAFVGGLILNLMPCVLPVLSLKVFSLVRHAGTDPKSAWKQGVAFTVGVVLSFLILAGLLIALRSAGNHLGWGFQMQSPGFVLALIFLFFLLGLNLFGVFELGTSLVGLDAKAAEHVSSGLTSSFLNGALATVAATPCTAPFMGSALGFAAQQPVGISLLIFTVLALGMATPYLLLTIFPGALRFVPKPGAWMEAFKQFMGFLLLATVVFLVYVFGALVGQEQVPDLLAALLLAGIAAWIYGRWGSPLHAATVRVVSLFLALICLGTAIGWGVTLSRTVPPAPGLASTDPQAWQPWSPAAVSAAIATGRPVFVDFTAAWCLSCKVNERLALESDAVKQAFAQRKVALFRADWTHADPTISATLQAYKRDGVPLYLIYTPSQKETPQVLPEVLTPDIVLDALKK